MRLCRQIGLFEHALVAIDGSKFKAVNNRDKNFTARKLDARKQQLETSVERYRESPKELSPVQHGSLGRDGPHHLALLVEELD